MGWRRWPDRARPGPDGPGPAGCAECGNRVQMCGRRDVFSVRRIGESLGRKYVIVRRAPVPPRAREVALEAVGFGTLPGGSGEIADLPRIGHLGQADSARRGHERGFVAVGVTVHGIDVDWSAERTRSSSWRHSCALRLFAGCSPGCSCAWPGRPPRTMAGPGIRRRVRTRRHGRGGRAHRGATCDDAHQGRQPSVGPHVGASGPHHALGTQERCDSARGHGAHPRPPARGPERFEVKTERVTWNGKTFNVYPDRSSSRIALVLAWCLSSARARLAHARRVVLGPGVLAIRGPRRADCARWGGARGPRRADCARWGGVPGVPGVRTLHAGVESRRQETPRQHQRKSRLVEKKSGIRSSSRAPSCR